MRRVEVLRPRCGVVGMYCLEPFLPSEARHDNHSADSQRVYKHVNLAFLQQPRQVRVFDSVPRVSANAPGSAGAPRLSSTLLVSNGTATYPI
jgi:hypothetical protein